MAPSLVMRHVEPHPAAPEALPTAAPIRRAPRAGRLAGALGLALWLGWSTLVAQMPDLGFRLTSNQLYWLAALPALAMAGSRVVSASLPGSDGGLGWRAWAGASLLPLALTLAAVIRLPATPFEALAGLALLCGSGAALAYAAIAPAGAGLAEQAALMRRKAAWLLCWLALGSLGTWAGLTAAVPLLARQVWSPALPLGWAGPIVAVLLLPLASRAAQRFGAARTALWAFAAMGPGAAAQWAAATLASPEDPLRGLLFAAGTATLFAACGLAVGGVLQMARPLFAAPDRRGAEAPRDAAAALGLAAALGAFGGFVLPKTLGTSLAMTGGPGAALALFVAFHLSCLALTWWHCARRFAAMPC